MNAANPRTIHRNLIVRISFTGFIISVLFGFAAWQYGKKDIRQEILLRAENGFKMLNSQIRDLFDNPKELQPSAIQRELDRIMSERRNIQLGLFIWVGIYDLYGKRIAQVRDDTYEHIERVEKLAGQVQGNMRKHDHLEFTVFDIEDVPHVQIISPIKNGLNELSAYGETFFAVSSDTLDNLWERAFALALSAMFVVIVTTALLYPVINNLLSRVSSLSAQLFEANLEILKVLGSAVAKRDSDTDSHNYRVTIISVKFAEVCGLPKEDIRRLIKGAFLHDVGKIGIEDEILHKPGRLTEDEFKVIKKHVAYGIDIVNKAEWIKEAVDIVGYHHEKFDGSGYDSGIEGGVVPKIARIFTIADVFDALSSRRPYKEPYSYDETIDIIRAGRGNHFDPSLVDAFETIARSIYKNYAGREDKQLIEELNIIIKKYFYE
ncbi:MAG: HD-GYP domain-containing protein [Thermodesulfobacteriota bacterium]|nr:HD-GYP domain-containing protein [Thermodesulfobacteriota bacterium]